MQKSTTRRTTSLRFMSAIITSSLFLTTPASAGCDILDLQRCSSCAALAQTIDPQQPDLGEYYRGAYWNGLYAAYKLNCQSVAKTLLDHQANPNLGGTLGSLFFIVAKAWPHNNHAINRQWLELLLHYQIDLDWKNPWTGKSARAIVDEKVLPISYPDIWQALLTKSSKGSTTR